MSLARTIERPRWAPKIEADGRRGDKIKGQLATGAKSHFAARCERRAVSGVATLALN